MASGMQFQLMNRVVNPALKAVLRSPLHPVASRRLALLTYTGRRSGKQYTTPVFYRDKGDRITVAVGWSDEKVWWRNLTGDGGPVELLVRGERLHGHAVATREGDQDAIVRIDLETPRG